MRCTTGLPYLKASVATTHKGPVVFRHREHMQRLHDSAKIYRFPVSQSVDELMEACREVIP
jgi:branched-chain amino acid aminotransferase